VLVATVAGVVIAIGSSVACGPDGIFPTTVDRGEDFGIAEVVFDENFFYCRVEPMLFGQSCGSGDPAQGDAQGGCHGNITSYRLTEYDIDPAGSRQHVADTCEGGLQPTVGPPAAARQNYQSSQARMKRDPNLAELLLRPTGAAQHPRVIFGATSAEADVIRDWATRFSSQ
jgi:hypothetical protein